MSTAIATIPQQQRADSLAYEPDSIQSALALAKVLVASRLLPRSITTTEQAFTIMAAGKELGLTSMQALRSIHIIEGKPSLSADLMVALVKRSPTCRYFRLVKSDDKIATYETLREGEPAPTVLSFTSDDALTAGLLGKDNWKKYRPAMLRARCIAALARAVYPDLVLGVYESDELERAEPVARRAPISISIPDEPPHDTITGEMVEPAQLSAPEAHQQTEEDPFGRMSRELAIGFGGWEEKRAWRAANKAAKDALSVEQQEKLTLAFVDAAPRGAREAK